MRYKKSAERIGPLVVLEVIGRRDHARGPGIKGVIAREGLCQLPRAVDRQRFWRFGCLTWPNHTRAQNEKARGENRCELHTFVRP